MRRWEETAVGDIGDFLRRMRAADISRMPEDEQIVRINDLVKTAEVLLPQIVNALMAGNMLELSAACAAACHDLDVIGRWAADRVPYDRRDPELLSEMIGSLYKQVQEEKRKDE
jgi:hypothetical protein